MTGKLRRSWWLLLPILGFSCLGGAAFIYFGVRERRPGWWIAGIAYLALGWTAIYTLQDADPDGDLYRWAMGLAFGVWIASIAHALLINRTVLNSP
ncbi:hypothetical protein [Actinoplanes sp. NBRC 103695]|uniref:hypothetical protein n=1 Tax=Actinoplanes sp. NBRC 103695 TaxID=3032202 RepID=UPI002552A789|nr:hypothetical protein [Actinoplanes sp. NBRC 103695]